VTWLVYGSPLVISNSEIAGVQAIANSGNLAVGSTTGTFTVQKLCFSGFFYVRMDSNYGLWFALGIMMLFFIITLSMDPKPMSTEVPFHEDPWTHHPIISILKVGNEIFTRK